MKQYSYAGPLGASQSETSLVNIVFDRLGKVQSATVVDSSSTTNTVREAVRVVEEVPSADSIVISSKAVPLWLREQDWLLRFASLSIALFSLNQ